MRRQYESELVPQVMAMGVSYDEFWKLTPRSLKVIVAGYKLRRRVDDEKAWLLGNYIFDAVSIAMGNAFRKKGQKPKEYLQEIKQPFLSKIDEERDENNLTDSEKKAKTELLFKNLEIMAANYKLSKMEK